MARKIDPVIADAFRAGHRDGATLTNPHYFSSDTWVSWHVGRFHAAMGIEAAAPRIGRGNMNMVDNLGRRFRLDSNGGVRMEEPR